MVDDVYIQAGRRIRRFRKKKGYSEEELAEKAEITRKFLHRIETGQSGFSAGTLVKLSNALEVNCNYILNDEVSSIEEKITETEKLLESKFIELRNQIEQLRKI